MYNMEVSIGSHKFRFEILVAIVVLFWVMFGHLLCSCSRVSIFNGSGMPDIGNITDVGSALLEGFTGANNTAYGPEFAGAKTPDYIMNPNTWARPTLTYSPGTKPDSGVQAIWNRPKQPIPLPEGELDMFATTEFKPECCPNAYSSSTGCAFMTTQQYQYLKMRSGNNVPYSEY